MLQNQEGNDNLEDLPQFRAQAQTELFLQIVLRHLHGCLELKWFHMNQKVSLSPTILYMHELKKMSDCRHCGATRFEYEPPTFCCGNGKIKLAPIEVPDELYDLFTSQSEEAIEFRNNIRVFNCIFSFTSFGVKLDKELASARRGVYTFRAQGMVYHNLPRLNPNENGPSNFQLYFVDTENEVTNRMNVLQTSTLSGGTVEKLIHVLEINPYAKIFRRLKDYPAMDELQLHISKDVKLDQRYPLLFPKGETGWHQNIFKISTNISRSSGRGTGQLRIVDIEDITRQPQGNTSINLGASIASDKPMLTNMSSEPNQGSNNPSTTVQQRFSSVEDVLSQEQEVINGENNQKVSCREYSCYRLQIRNARQSTLLLAGRLLQQYAVDMYIKLETTRLDYFRRNQTNLRAELYQGLIDSVSRGEKRGGEVGKRIVLPASFIGGPRDMRRRYLDALALVQRFGKPDLFITMTCNPEWKEIQENLYAGQQAQDRLDLTSRVFRSKLQDLKDQLFKKEIFGKVVAHVHVIEFQKRGLPHAHMLIILKSEYKITTPEQFDKFVCAELPDKEKYPGLYDLVLKHMMHGPCGELNFKNSCMIEGKCKYHYPRSYCESTVQGKDGYPIYKRKRNGVTAEVRKAKLDNQWVVPYNPYLLSRYNCHINVEICSGVTAVKYLYKYIYKGHDRVAFQISQKDQEMIIDEIKQFQDARWVSAQEAMWRIFEFNLNEMYPSVINLPLHLPNQQSVTYWGNQNLENVLRWDHTSKTMLTEYFSMCAKSEDAKKYLYREFPEHYVWDNKFKCWNERKKRNVIGRVNGANPIEGERFYLRLLLNHVRGPTSFEDLLTVNHKKCSSFKEAAQRRVLLESDQSLTECLNEAISFQMPHELRRLFAIILVYCAPTDVKNLWDTYFDPMSEDFKREPGTTDMLQLVKTLKSLNYFLESMGKTIKSYDLPKIPVEYNNIQDDLPSKKRIAIATATSGVAAAIMPGGRTAHSRFKIPLDANASSSCSISKQSGAAELLRKAQLIIWDEAPMAKRWAIENVDKCLQDIMGNDKYFGGKVVVFGGDFRQVLPVVPRGTVHQTICASLVKSPLWEPTDTEGNVKIPEEMIIDYDNDEDSIHRLITAIFPSLGENSHSAGYMTGRAILATRNEHVDKLNEKLISIFPGESREYHSYDEAIDDTNNFYDEEFLNSLTPNGLPPHKLLLKKNCPIILLRNLDPSNGLCNGTRMVCKNFKDNVIDAEIVFGQHSGKHVFIPRIPLSLAENEGPHGRSKISLFLARPCQMLNLGRRFRRFSCGRARIALIFARPCQHTLDTILDF
ncbi:hypothetical protein ACP275_07G104200 [Erythranthe tilingii]